MVKTVFLATSFTHKVDPAGMVLPEFRGEIEALLKGIREHAGANVFCAVEDEGWNIKNTPAEIAVKHDLDKLDQSDIMLAVMDHKISAGVQFEIGYCVGKGKPVILAVQQGTDLAYYNRGAVGAGWVTLITYADIEALIPQVTLALNAPREVLS